MTGLKLIENTNYKVSGIRYVSDTKQETNLLCLMQIICYKKLEQKEKLTRSSYPVKDNLSAPCDLN